MPLQSSWQASSTANNDLANRLHSAAIHLLRRLRSADAASGLSAPRLSALSVIVFAGPITVTELARAEQVRPATISRLVKELEWAGLVERAADPADRRRQQLRATAAGEQLLQAGRRRRVAVLAADLARLDPAGQAALAAALPILESLALPLEHPRRQTELPEGG